jgi:hypothetical protein
MFFGSKKQERRYAFSLPLKSPCKRTPSTFPNRAHMERFAGLQSLFYVYFKFRTKISLNKKNSLFLKALGKELSSMFLKSWAPMERDGHF